MSDVKTPPLSTPTRLTRIAQADPPPAKTAGYLDASDLAAFDRYKYNSEDTSPLAVYVMKPFWSAIVRNLPTWLAPNVMTFVGFLLILMCTVITYIYDPDLTAAHFPAWIWFACAVMQFLGHQLDGCDGMQARRTGMSSPVGELFDHGLDSMVCSLQVLTTASAVSRVDPRLIGSMQMCASFGFYFTHLEKYSTGKMFLPWSYDVSQLMLAAVYLGTGILGSDFWHQNIEIQGTGVSVNFVDIFVLSTCLGGIFAVPSSLYRMWQAHASNKQKYSWSMGMIPALPLLFVYGSVSLWAELAGDVFRAHPKDWMAVMGVLFSHLACRLIIAQMTGLPFKLRSVVILVPLLPCMLAGYFGMVDCLWALRGYLAFAIILHVHFGVSVVQEMCAHFDIHAWDTSKKPKLRGT